MPLLAALVLCQLASAQQVAQAKEVMFGRLCLLAAVTSIRKEIKVTEPQAKKLDDIFDGTVKAEGERIRLTVNNDTDLPGIEKDVLAVLDQPQKDRLEEIWIQRTGPLAIGDDGISKKLNLTPVQKSEVDGLLVEGAKKLQELFSALGDADSPKRAAEVRADIARRILRALTDDQRHDFEGLKGKPFRPGEIRR